MAMDMPDIIKRIKELTEARQFLERAESIGGLYRRAPARYHASVMWEAGLIVNALVSRYGTDL
jgi:hypothetical protein